MGESKDKAKTKEKKTPFFKGLKAEFNKIIWPDKTTLTKQTVCGRSCFRYLRSDYHDL